MLPAAEVTIPAPPAGGHGITVCPDAFKGSLSSPGVAIAITNGLATASDGTAVFVSPMSDGGHGLLDCLYACTSSMADADPRKFTEFFVDEPSVVPPYPRGLTCLSCQFEDASHPTLNSQVIAAGGLFSVRGRYLVRPAEKYAVVEMAEVAGLPQVEAAAKKYVERYRRPTSLGDNAVTELIPIKDSRQASSFAVGQLLCEIGQRWSRDEMREVYIGLGGSCTNDCGMGMLQSLGVEVYMRAAKNVDGCQALQSQEPTLLTTPIVASLLSSISHINCNTTAFRSFINRWRNPSSGLLGIHVVCDVTNPLLGAAGATAVYGPQKLGLFDWDVAKAASSGLGAAVEVWKGTVLSELEAGVSHCQHILDGVLTSTATSLPDTKRFHERPIRSCGVVPGAGAAGGLGAALLGFLAPYAELCEELDHSHTIETTRQHLLVQEGSSGAELLQGPKFTNVFNLVSASDIVVTGEGAFDRQTIEFGKTVSSIYKTASHAARDQKRRKLVIVVCGIADTTSPAPPTTTPATTSTRSTSPAADISAQSASGWGKWNGGGSPFARRFYPAQRDDLVTIVVCPLTGFKTMCINEDATTVAIEDDFVDLHTALNQTAEVITRLVDQVVVPKVIVPWKAVSATE